MFNIKEELTREPTKEDHEYYKLQIEYEKIIKENNNQDDELYPFGWLIDGTLEERIEILKEAIQKKCKINETEGYLNIIEGVIIDNKTDKEER